MQLAELLDAYEVVSFDVFDTLLLRPFAAPADIFYLVGQRIGYFNFKEIRVIAEREARQKSGKPNDEIDIYDIYRELARRSGVSPTDAELEISLEEELCYANPYMLELFSILKSRNKTVVIVSDMYLPASVIKNILHKNGYVGYSKLYISCDRGCNKSSGQLFKMLKNDFGDSIIHIGDSVTADIEGAKKAKIDAYHYKQCNEIGNSERPYELLSPFGSMYRGIVNNAVYNGASIMSERESFAFTYAGTIAVGFCEWLNSFCRERGLEKIFFLSRDMSSVFKVYNRHFRELDNEYVITSRFAMQELIVSDYPEEYFYHTVRARCDRGYTIRQTLCEINLELLISRLAAYGLSEMDNVSSDKLPRLKELFIDNKERIAEHFSDNERAARSYFADALGGARRICVADLGWRGSIIAYLKYLLVDKWRMCDEVKGALIASTVNDSSVELISDGTVTPYVYSHMHNRDFLTLCDWNKEYIRIMTLEAVFTSEERSLLEYRMGDEGEYELIFGAENRNADIVNEFSRGIERFADELERTRRSYRSYFPISASDAFIPMHSILENYEYIARIIGDVVDTPYALAGIGIKNEEYVSLGELLRERNMISTWESKK